MKKTILVSGGSGNLATELTRQFQKGSLVALPKEELNICDPSNIKDVLDSLSPEYFIHTAALTRPMKAHTEDPGLSIRTNIVGTANVALECIKRDIKLIYISTDYVYPGISGNYNEESPLLPVNDYAWSKLGGECSVNLCPNSLILRMALCESPFPHPRAVCDIKKSYISIENGAALILKLKDQKGIINIGGPPSTPYDFAKQSRPKVEKLTLAEVNDTKLAKDSTLNIDKLKALL